MKRLCVAIVTLLLVARGALGVELYSEDDVKYKLLLREPGKPERQDEIDEHGHWADLGPDVWITLMNSGEKIHAVGDERWSIKDDKFLKRDEKK